MLTREKLRLFETQPGRGLDEMQLSACAVRQGAEPHDNYETTRSQHRDKGGSHHPLAPAPVRSLRLRTGRRAPLGNASTHLLIEREVGHTRFYAAGLFLFLDLAVSSPIVYFFAWAAGRDGLASCTVNRVDR